MKRIKVLIVAGTMGCGGIENQLMHLLRQADKNKFQIDFTTTEEDPFYKEEIIALGGKCLKLPSTEGKYFFRYCKALFKTLREGDYDVVHSHELFHSGMVLLTARLAGVKSRIVHAHNWKEGNNPKEKKSFKRYVYNYIMQRLIRWNATEFIACSTLAGKYLYGDKIINKENYHLIFNSVDTTKFIEKYGTRESGDYTSDDWIYVLQVGRFTPVKNQLFTADIVRELKKRGKNICVLCAGNNGGSYEERVVDRIREYDIETQMQLIGVRRDIDVLMRKSSAFLLPSLYEGMPLVMIEAQASGLPCVTADTYSREVDFGIGLVNWLQIEDDVSIWADAIEHAVNRERCAKELIVNAIETKGFDSKVFAKRICDLYYISVKRNKK